MNRLNRKIRQVKFLVYFPLVAFLSITILPFTDGLSKLEASEFGMLAEILLQSGVTFYDQGRFLDAMSEFKKALIVDPHSTIAKAFLRRIQQELPKEIQETRGDPRFQAMQETLDKVEMKRRVLENVSGQQQGSQPKKELTYDSLRGGSDGPQTTPISPEKTIVLDDQIKTTQPNTVLELNRDISVIIKGDNIKRFLSNTPEKIEITRFDKDSVLVTATEFGRSILHIWDNNGRWSFNIKGTQKLFTKAFREELERMDSPIGLSEPFKLTYSFDWSSFHSGRRIDTTERQSLSLNQSVSLRGDTPYGKFDSALNIYRLNKEYEVDNLRMGLTDGHFWGMKDLDIRLFDFTPGFSAYKFSKIELRGVGINAPMSNNKFSYSAFWGGIPEGTYTNLSPGLGNTYDAYLEGIGLQYLQSKNARYKAFFVHSYGPDINEPILTNRHYGLGAFYNIGKLNFNSEVAHDGIDHISYITSARLTLPKTIVSFGFTEEDRDFAPILGGNPAGGSTSARFGINFSPTKDFSISNNFTATRDRDLFNPADAKRPNYTFDTDANWRLDPFTTVNVGYSRDDRKGSISPGISETRKFGLRKQVFFIKKLSTFLNYSNFKNKYYSTSASNYNKDTLSVGLGFNLVGNLYWNISESFNFTKNTLSGETTNSRVMETALSYYSRIFDSPFYGRFRLSYRDEEDAGSILSYLSGEDRLELQAELSYRPNPYFDAYLSGRVANVWAETEGTTKHLDAEVRYGVRIAWDTGLRWNTKGGVQGFVFYDLDGDSFKDIGEGGVKGVLINATAKKGDITNNNGFYLIQDIIGKEARVSVDLNSIPRGFTLTTPSFYDFGIKHNEIERFNFGITARAEIVGVVFVDLNGNNKFDRGEDSLGGVVVVLDDTNKVTTDDGGQYLFRQVLPGEHLLKIDLKTIPAKYIPKVSLRKKIELEEGTSYFYNIPLGISN